ncbi:MAG TPA: ABC transporter ATP-binding protein [Methylomirabilota bacterium]|nr:ABC transporter ATP-binding protein [Methylomirabilota bacterium]
MKKNAPVITLKDITKSYNTADVSIEVLHSISLTIHKGEFVAITGPSGSGKSTLLHIIGLLDRATSGKYFLHDDDVTKLTEDEQAHVRNREIGFVFQSFNLLQRTSVLENVVLPAVYAGMKTKEREDKAQELLAEVGIDEHMFKKPNQLSGGQQQRVAIARALMNDPSIILADEPTGNLDSTSGKDVMNILKNLYKEGKTIIVITHDSTIARQTERIITLKDGMLV